VPLKKWEHQDEETDRANAGTEQTKGRRKEDLYILGKMTDLGFLGQWKRSWTGKQQSESVPEFMGRTSRYQSQAPVVKYIEHQSKYIPVRAHDVNSRRQ
jgi:hypothetical protein